MKKIIFIILISIFTFSYTYASIDFNCFLSKQNITTDEQNIAISSKENDLYAFTTNGKILKLLSYGNYKKKFYSYYIMDKNLIGREYKEINESGSINSKNKIKTYYLPIQNIKDNNKKSYFKFDNLYNNNYRFTIRFDYTLLANTFDYEFLTNNQNYKIEVSKDNNKWREISKKDLLKENINYIRFTFLIEKDPITKKYIYPKEPIKIYHLKFFNKGNYDYIFKNNKKQKITIYKDYICDREILLKEVIKNEYDYKNTSTKNTSTKYIPNFILNKKEEVN